MRFLYYVNHPKKIIPAALLKFRCCLSDRLFLRLFYYHQMDKPLNLKNPQTFSEKLQWLKLYSRKPEYTTMVDKHAVKEYVSKIIGEQFIIPTLGTWENAEAIDWDSLPNQFVLKTTNGGGSKGVVICKDKSRLDRKNVIQQLNKAMKRDIYKLFGEWPYKDVKPRILAEKYMHDKQNGEFGLKDYKFFCFNGIPTYCQVISNRESGMAIDFFDMDWRHQPFHEPRKYGFADVMPSKPQSFDEMRRLATTLSAGIPFIRVDFYEIEGKPFFGELTFFPTSGMGGFDPEEWDEIWGRLIILPQNKTTEMKRLQRTS